MNIHVSNNVEDDQQEDDQHYDSDSSVYEDCLEEFTSCCITSTTEDEGITESENRVLQLSPMFARAQQSLCPGSYVSNHEMEDEDDTAPGPSASSLTWLTDDEEDELETPVNEEQDIYYGCRGLPFFTGDEKHWDLELPNGHFEPSPRHGSDEQSAKHPTSFSTEHTFILQSDIDLESPQRSCNHESMGFSRDDTFSFTDEKKHHIPGNNYALAPSSVERPDVESNKGNHVSSTSFFHAATVNSDSRATEFAKDSFVKSTNSSPALCGMHDDHQPLNISGSSDLKTPDKANLSLSVEKPILTTAKQMISLPSTSGHWHRPTAKDNNPIDHRGRDNQRNELLSDIASHTYNDAILKDDEEDEDRNHCLPLCQRPVSRRVSTVWFPTPTSILSTKASQQNGENLNPSGFNPTILYFGEHLHDDISKLMPPPPPKTGGKAHGRGGRRRPHSEVGVATGKSIAADSIFFTKQQHMMVNGYDADDEGENTSKIKRDKMDSIQSKSNMTKDQSSEMKAGSFSQRPVP
ncbi:uncharacterized protein LOC134076117 [Sardina pilchardus]|uniref:uncharacterized protein LOC134076117 n=1 Tax=Sardina pilchardus TaxID=27697 RepID=UPI002E1488C1